MAESLGDEVGLECHIPISTTLLLEDEPAAHNVMDTRHVVYKSPGPSISDGSKFFEDHSVPRVTFWASQGISEGGVVRKGSALFNYLICQVCVIANEA